MRHLAFDTRRAQPNKREQCPDAQSRRRCELAGGASNTKTPARSQTLLLRPHALPAQPRPDPQRDQTTAAEQAFTRTFRSAPESASKPPTSNITSTLRLTAHASKLDSQQKEAPPAADTATDAPSAPHEEAQQGATRRIHRSAQAESCPGGNRSVLTAGAQPHTRHAYTRRRGAHKGQPTHVSRTPSRDAADPAPTEP